MGGVNVSGIVKDAALNLGLGAVPQLSHLLRGVQEMRISLFSGLIPDKTNSRAGGKLYIRYCPMARAPVHSARNHMTIA
jgi:hypothetical protein